MRGLTQRILILSILAAGGWPLLSCDNGPTGRSCLNVAGKYSGPIVVTQDFGSGVTGTDYRVFSLQINQAGCSLTSPQMVFAGGTVSTFEGSVSGNTLSATYTNWILSANFDGSSPYLANLYMSGVLGGNMITGSFTGDKTTPPSCRGCVTGTFQISR